jgi:hypothetical protein
MLARTCLSSPLVSQASDMTETRDPLSAALHRYTCRANSPHTYVRQGGYSVPTCEAAASDPAIRDAPLTTPDGLDAERLRQRQATDAQFVIDRIRHIDRTLEFVLTSPTDGHIPIWAREDRVTVARVIGYLSGYLPRPLAESAIRDASLTTHSDLSGEDGGYPDDYIPAEPPTADNLREAVIPFGDLYDEATTLTEPSPEYDEWLRRAAEGLGRVVRLVLALDRSPESDPAEAPTHE